MIMFSITISPNNMKCIEIENPSEKERNIIRSAILENRMDHPAYIAKRKSMPFLQADYYDYILIEFWGKDPQPFLDYINKQMSE